MVKIRQDAWLDRNDKLLAEIVLRHVREGSTQLNAFEEAGDALNRTAAACGFRWNGVVRKEYEEELAEAKKERKRNKKRKFFMYRPHLINEDPTRMPTILGDLTYEAHQVKNDVLTERKRQNEKWGEQHHPDTVWLTITMEEIGEVAQAMQKDWGWGKPTDQDDLYKEIIHASAVLQSWAEQILKDKKKE